MSFIKGMHKKQHSLVIWYKTDENVHITE